MIAFVYLNSTFINLGAQTIKHTLNTTLILSLHLFVEAARFRYHLLQMDIIGPILSHRAGGGRGIYRLLGPSLLLLMHIGGLGALKRGRIAGVVLGVRGPPALHLVGWDETVPVVTAVELLCNLVSLFEELVFVFIPLTSLFLLFFEFLDLFFCHAFVVRLFTLLWRWLALVTALERIRLLFGHAIVLLIQGAISNINRLHIVVRVLGCLHEIGR